MNTHMLTTIIEAFEGMALGSRIAAIQWAPRAMQPWIMVAMYGLT